MRDTGKTPPDSEWNWTEPKYENSIACSAAEVTPATLQTWVNRGLVNPYERNPGYGQRRLYSVRDVVRLATMGRLTVLGLNARTASNVCSLLDEDWLREAYRPRGIGLLAIKRTSDGRLFVPRPKNFGHVEAVLGDGACVLVNLREIVQTVARKLRNADTPTDTVDEAGAE